MAPIRNWPTACWPTSLGHATVLLAKLDAQAERDWYAAAAAEHGWSRNVLLNQIMNRLTSGSGPPRRTSPTSSRPRTVTWRSS